MEWFWDESIWCPPNVKWADFRPDSAHLKDLYYSFFTVAILIVVRLLLERALFRPLAGYLAPEKRPARASKTAGDESRRTAKSAERRVSRRLVLKLSETMWRFSFYLAASIYGWFFVLWDKPYLKDTMYTLYDYPHHPVKPEEWLYYNIELGFYISLVITQFTDVKRKDFWQMFAHHIITIVLLVLSWTCNFHRLGALVLAIHDIADVPLEGAKLAKYCEKQRLADLVFAIFTFTWIFTRCYLLPTRVIYYTSYKALSIIPIFPAYYIFNALLCLLQLLHLAWTYLIICMVVDALKNDGMRDLRSDSEDSSESHED